MSDLDEIILWIYGMGVLTGILLSFLVLVLA